jgi:hypothetical protein
MTLIASALLLVGCEEETVTGNAKLELKLVGFAYEFRDGRHTYNHDRHFAESAGIGVSIKRGKVCVRDGEDCVDALVKYRIEASQTLVQKGHHVATPAAKDTITMHYWAEDDAGNAFELPKVLKTNGESVVVE